MSDLLHGLLAKRPWLLADGATGTSYFALGLTTGDSPELWNVEHPERVESVHRSFIEAGSDIVLTNSFGGNRLRLKLHDLQDRVGELNAAAARIARNAAETADRPIVVAGSLGPTGEILAPLGPLPPEDAAKAFAHQAEALAEGGADVLWIETLSSVEELNAALEGAGRIGLPIVCTLSFDTNGRTMMGLAPSAFAAICREHPVQPMGIGANCGVGASECLVAVLGIAEAVEAAGSGDIVVAKSNCGVPQYVEGELTYSGTPPLMADYARLALDAGARIIGGCCGTTPEHVAAMRRALESHERGEKPSLETIVAHLGPISAGAEKTAAGQPLGDMPDDAEGGGRRRRGRRRAAAE